MVGGREGRAPLPPESLQGPSRGPEATSEGGPPDGERPLEGRASTTTRDGLAPNNRGREGRREHGEKRGTRKAVRQRPPSLLPWLDGREEGKKGRMLIIFSVPFGGYGQKRSGQYICKASQLEPYEAAKSFFRRPVQEKEGLAKG